MIAIVLTVSGARQSFNQALKFGEIIRFRCYNVSGATTTNYDDNVVLTLSGTSTLASGLVQPLDETRGAADAILLQQGRLLQNDIKMYTDNSVNTSGVWKVTRFLNSTGSPQAVSLTYAPIEQGITNWGINGSVVYKKMYLRVLTNGSLQGES